MKNKLFVVITLIIVLHISMLGAESDNGKFLPDIEPFSIGNIFVSLEPARLQFPLGFAKLGITSMTNLGYGLSGSIGYNWSGWLFGLNTNYAHYGQGLGAYALMNSFDSVTIGFQLSRVISQRTVKYFPSWFELVPAVGVGADFISTNYYPSQRAKEEGRAIQIPLVTSGA